MIQIYWAKTHYKVKQEALLVARKEIGLEINAEKSKHVRMSPEQKTRNVITYRQETNSLK
jgi:hypothetical protein